jgi:thiol-disulfide isomerase/thioredoxin
MKRRRREVLGLSAAGLAGLAGCLGDAGTASTPDPDDEPQIEPADWRTAPVEDVRTGEQFTIGGHDVPVVVHTFAVWCGSCRTQQNHLAEFHDSYDGDVVGIDLNVDENEGPERIREHLDEHGHDWHFGVSPPGLTRALVDEFSPKLASGPGSPVVVICPDGEHAILDDFSTPAADVEAAVRSC